MPCRVDYELSDVESLELDYNRKIDKLETDLCILRDFLIKTKQLKKFEEYQQKIYLEDQLQHRKEDKDIFVKKILKQSLDLVAEITYYSNIKEKESGWVLKLINDKKSELDNVLKILKFVQSLTPEQILTRVYYKEQLLF